MMRRRKYVFVVLGVAFLPLKLTPMNRKAFKDQKMIPIIVLLFAIFCSCQVALASVKDASRCYASLALGMQEIYDSDHQTAAMQGLSPEDKTNFAERVGVGYGLSSYFALETGLTLFSGYNYHIEPYENTVHRDFAALDCLAKLRYSPGRFHSFVGVGAAVVYSNVDNFSLIFPDGSGDDESVHSVVWGSHYFVRPELAAGVSYQFFESLNLGIMASYIFSQGNFSSSLVSVDGEPSLLVDSNNLPAMTFLGIVVEFAV